MEYVHLFENTEQFNNYVLNDYKEPFVGGVSGVTALDTYFNIRDEQLADIITDTYKNEYFTFEVISGGTLGWVISGRSATSSDKLEISYSKNNGISWTTIENSENYGTPISVSPGDKVMIKATNKTYYTKRSIRYYLHFFSASTGTKVNVYGNIMSLTDGDNFSAATELVSAGTFNGLFAGMHDSLVDAKKLVLPATTLSVSAYTNMFKSCTSLKTCPMILPATALMPYCYYDMFWDCASLSCFPIMKATVMSNRCYAYMFEGCTSLTTAPQLQSTWLSDHCYMGMFSGCTSLTTAPELPATTLADYCYYSMFHGCTSLTTAPVLPSTTLADYCYYSMFYGCTSLTTAPVLPATTLVQGCYSTMFHGCTSLTTAPVLPATTLAQSCYYSMFYGCTSLTTAPVLPSTTLVQGCYSTMFYGCTSLTTAPVLPATTLADYCYSGMFQGCTGLTTAPVLPATTLEYSCYSTMFYGCTSLTTAPVLPATTLAQSCYSSMFNGCTSLNYVKCLATDISANSCVAYWLQNVSSSGTFVKSENMSDWPTGTSGIPSGWDVVDQNAITPLTFRACGNGGFYLFTTDTAATKTIEYRVNGGNWTSYTSSTALTTSISVSSGDTVQLRGDNAHYDLNHFSASTPFYAYGNIMSLIDSTGFTTLKTLPQQKSFKELFASTSIRLYDGTNGPEFVLPATGLSEQCYMSMFEFCSGLTVAPKLPATTVKYLCYYLMFRETSITVAPELPATTLAQACYASMFHKCASLTTAPALPATVLQPTCYTYMFVGTSITTAPELPAETLVDNCYSGMFYDCTSLNYVKCLATDISANNCVANWLQNVATSGTFVKHPNMTSWTSGISGIPQNWTTEDATI